MTTGFFALDAAALPWEQRMNPHLPAPIFRKVLHTDPETGVFFQIVKYPKGVINPSHTHPCAHAIYVLEGTWHYEIAGKPVTAKAGDVLFVPAGTIHSAKNVGSGNAAELATYLVEKGQPLLSLAK